MRKVLGLSVAIALLALFVAPANAYIVDSDVGNAALTGRADWDIDNSIMDVYASGTDIWDAGDGLHFYSEAFDVLDAIDLVARAYGFDGGTNDWRKQGLMIRDTLDGNSANAITLIAANPANGVRQQWRYTAGANTDGRPSRGNPVPAQPPALPGYEPAPQWLRIQRDAVTPEDYAAGVPQQIHYYYADGAGLKPGTIVPTQVPRDVDGIPGQDFEDPDGIPGSGDEIFLFDTVDMDANPWIELLGTDIDPGPDGIQGTADDLWLDVPQLLNLQGDANGKIYAGLAVTSHDNSQITRGRFTDISGIELPDVYTWYGADMDPGTYPGGVGEWRDVLAWTAQSSSGGATSFPQANADVHVLDQGGPIIRDAETVRTLNLLGAAPQLIFDEAAPGAPGSLTVQGPLDAGAGMVLARASGTSITAPSGAIGGLVLGRPNGPGMDAADFALNVRGTMTVNNLAGVGRLTVQGGGTLSLTDDLTDPGNRPIKADGIGFTIDHATLAYVNASNSIVSGGQVLALGGSYQEIILDSGTLDVQGEIGTTPNMLAHYGWNHITESEIHYLDGSQGASLMTLTPDHMGAPLTTGPGGRGLSFTSDLDFMNSGAITQGDNYSNLWVGKLHVADTELNQNFMLRNQDDDDLAGIWLDKNNNGVFEAGEEIVWSPLSAPDRNAKTFQFTTAGDYMVAFTQGEWGGGSNASFYYQAPGMTAEALIKPAAQPNRWLAIGPDAVDITNDITVSGDSTIRFTTLGTSSLAFVGLNDGANLTLASGPMGMNVETVAGLNGGVVTLNSANTINMAYYRDSELPVTINKAGAGTLNLGIITEGPDAGPNSGSNTTLRIQGGSFRPVSQAALGGGVDGYIKLDLAGGSFDIRGADVTVEGAPGLLVGSVGGNINTTAANTGNVGVDSLGTSIGQTNAAPPWLAETTFIFTGQVYIDASGVISFREDIDDKAWLTVDGVKLLDDGNWGTPTVGTISRPEGWYPFELRLSNGGGGAGQVTAPGFGYSRTNTSGNASGGLYAAALNTNAATRNLFRTAPGVLGPAVAAIDWRDTDFSVSADSTLNAVTTYTAQLGNLTLTGGMLTVKGAGDGLSFESTTVAPAAPKAAGWLGLNTTVKTYSGPLNVPGADPATMTKTGAADLRVTQAPVAVGSNATIEVRQGNLVSVGVASAASSPLGQATLKIADLTTPAILQADAIAYFGFEDAAGSGTAADTSGRGLDYTGAITGGGLTSVPGKVGNAMYFDGVDDFVTMGTAALAADPNAPVFKDFASGVSVAAWVNYETFTNWARIVDIGRGAGDSNILLARRDTSGNAQWETYNPNFAHGVDGLFSPGNWYHFVGTRDFATGASNIYLDGAVRSSATAPNGPVASVVRQNAYIGESNWGGDALLQGTMDELYIFDRAITGTEVSALFANSRSGGGNIVLSASAPTVTYPNNVIAEANGSLILRQVDEPGSVTGATVNLDGDVTIGDGALTVDLRDGYSLNVLGSVISSGIGELTLRGGPVSVATMPLLDIGALRIISPASLSGYHSVTTQTLLELQGAGATMTFAAPTALVTTPNTTVRVTDGATLTNDTALATKNFEVLNGSAYVNTGVGLARDINISGDMTVSNSTITNYGSIQVAGNLTLDGAGAQLSFSPDAGTTLATTDTTMVILRNQASLTTATGLHSSGLQILSGANFNRVGDLIADPTNRDVWVNSVLTLNGASLNMVDNGGLPASTLHLGDNTAVTIGPGQLLKIKDPFDSGSLEIYGTLEMTGADKSISVNNALIMGTGKTLDMSANILNTGPNALVTIGKDSVLIVGGGVLLNGGNGFANIRGLDVQGHLERLGDPYSENDMSIGVTERLGVGDGQTLDQRGYLLSTGPNTFISVGQGGVLRADTQQQGNKLTVTGGIIDVPALTINGQMTFADTTIDAALHGTGGVLLEGMGITGQVNLTNVGNDYTGKTEIRSGVLDVGHVDDTAGNATNEGGLGKQGNLSFASRWRDKWFNDGDKMPQSPAVLQANGLFQRVIGAGDGQVNWNRDWWGGGFAARGDAPLGDPANNLTVTLNNGGEINMGDTNNYNGFQERWIDLNSPTANGVINLTNQLRVWGGRNVYVWDNPKVQTDWAEFSGNIWDWKLIKYGPGLLKISNATNTLPFTDIRWGGIYYGTINGNGDGSGLAATTVQFDGNWWDERRGTEMDEYGVLLANGILQRKIATGWEQGGGYLIRFNEEGGFAARGEGAPGDPANNLTVTLENNTGVNAELQWGDNNRQDGLRDNTLLVGSRYANGMMTFTNPVVMNHDNDIVAQDNPFTDQDVAKLTGSIRDSGTGDRRVSIQRGNASNKWGGTVWIDAPLLLGGNTHDRVQVDDGVLRMDVAKLNGQARIEMSADNYDRPAIWESWGTISITMADGGAGTFKLHRDYNNAKGGGLAAWSAPFTVSFMRTGNSTPNYPLRWVERDFGFHDMVLQLGSPTANDVVTITNDIDLWGVRWYDESGDRGVVDDGRMIRLFDNPFSENDRAVLSGKITDSFGPIKFYIRGAGRLALTNQNTFSDDVVVQSVEGPITLDLNHVLNLGNINNKLYLSDVNLNIGSSFGNATKQASLSGSLGVDIAKYSNLTLEGAADPGIGKSLTKKGLGGLTLNGLSISGNVDYQGGLLTLGSGVLALPGGQVNIADGLNLNVSGMVAKKVVGSATTTTLTAVGNTVIGGLGTENGYDYAGRILTGNKSVSLLRDGALSLGGAVLGNIAGEGTLSSANGIRLLPVTGPPSTISPKMIVGVGTVNGNIDLNGGRIRGTAAGNIKLTGIIGGSGIVTNADLTKAVLWPSHTLLPSKGETKAGIAGVDVAPGMLSVNIAGPNGGDLDNWVEGDYDQVVNAVYGNGAIDLSGTTLSLSRLATYTPSTSAVFRILNQAPATWGDEYNGWYKGFFSNVSDPLATPASFPAGQNWHWEFNWKNQAANEFWDAYITTQSGPPPTGPTVPSAYLANNTLPLRAPLAKLISSQLPNPATLSYPGLDSAARAEIAVFNPTYLDSELATGGMRGLLYEVANGLFETFSINPADDQYQGPFRLMMWRNNFWVLGAEGIVPDHTYDLSQYMGAQDKFVIMWDDPSLAPNIREGSVNNPAAYNWLSTLTFSGGAKAAVNLSVTPVPEPGTLVLLICGGLALLVWRRRRAG